MKQDVDRPEQLNTDLITHRQAAAILGVHPDTVRKWADEGVLPCVRLRVPGRGDAEEAPRPITFAGWWEGCRAYCKTSNRSTSYGRKVIAIRKHVLPILGAIPLENVSPRELENLQSKMLSNGLAAATVRQKMAHVSQLFTRAMRLGVLSQNPMTGVDRVQVKPSEQPSTHMSFEETDGYLKAALKEGANWYTLFLMALRTGMRKGELLGLKWSAVDLERSEVTISMSRTMEPLNKKIVEGPPKSGHNRTVGLTPGLVQALKALPSRFRWEYVFTDKNGKALTPYAERPVHLRIVKRAGKARTVRFHDLRHSWASHMAMHGVPLAQIQHLGGWHSLAMVQRYAHLSKESVVGAVMVLENGQK